MPVSTPQGPEALPLLLQHRASLVYSKCIHTELVACPNCIAQCVWMPSNTPVKCQVHRRLKGFWFLTSRVLVPYFKEEACSAKGMWPFIKPVCVCVCAYIPACMYVQWNMLLKCVCVRVCVCVKIKNIPESPQFKSPIHPKLNWFKN